MLSFTLSSRKEKIISILLSLWVISFVVILTTFISPFLYDLQINSFHLPTYVGMSEEAISKNFHNIVGYLSIFYRGDMQYTPWLISTKGTIQHFKDVKVVLEVIQIYFIASTIVLIPMIKDCIKNKQIHFLRMTSIILIVIIGIVGSFMAINFDSAFVLMHKIIFRNDYWLIDPAFDPIINIFPEDFFMELGIVIVAVIAGIIILGFVLYQVLSKHYIKQEKTYE